MQTSTKGILFIQGNIASPQLHSCLGIRHNHSATEHALQAGQGGPPAFCEGGSACGASRGDAQEADAVVQVYEEGKKAGDSCQSQGAGAHCPRGEVALEDLRQLGCEHQGDGGGGEEASLKAHIMGGSQLWKGTRYNMMVHNAFSTNACLYSSAAMWYEFCTMKY